MTSLSATVASVVRVFKDHSRQITHDRNRLDEDKAGKLALISAMYRLEEGIVAANKAEPNIISLFDKLEMCEVFANWTSTVIEDDFDEENKSSVDETDTLSVYSDLM